MLSHNNRGNARNCRHRHTGCRCKGTRCQESNIPTGIGHHATPQALIPVPQQDWEEGPGGLMSLGDMLRMAGYHVGVEDR
eukprot:2317947-Karenia_brevis.AAC.1